MESFRRDTRRYIFIYFEAMDERENSQLQTLLNVQPFGLRGGRQSNWHFENMELMVKPLSTRYKDSSNHKMKQTSQNPTRHHFRRQDTLKTEAKSFLASQLGTETETFHQDFLVFPPKIYKSPGTSTSATLPETCRERSHTSGTLWKPCPPYNLLQTKTLKSKLECVQVLVLFGGKCGVSLNAFFGETAAWSSLLPSMTSKAAAKGATNLSSSGNPITSEENDVNMAHFHGTHIIPIDICSTKVSSK